MYCLTINTGPDAGRKTPLPDGEQLLIGRDSGCGLRLSDQSVSRVHCRVTANCGKVWLEDTSSRWGTLVNGRAVVNGELAPGDKLVIGDSELVLERQASGESTVTPRRNPEHATPASGPGAPGSPAGTSDVPGSAGSPFLERLAGEQFLRFRVGARIATTASGVVYRAYDPRREQTVALKLFRRECFADERAQARFIRAVRTMLPIEHPHLVRLLTAGRYRGTCFTASEFAEGENVAQIIARIGIAGMLDWRHTWRIALGVARALEHAHERQIIHRGVKPSNILVASGDHGVKLGDLVLAKALDDAGANGITRPGEIVGDLHYLAPEQLSGGANIDARADIYSLGATLYALLTGRPPFTGNPAVVVQQVLRDAPQPVRAFHLAVPSLFGDVVQRMLAKQPDDRHGSATALSHDLERVGKYQGLTTSS